jgi:hypothetical protein
MSLIQRDQPVQTFPAHRPDQPFTEGIGLRSLHGRLQHAYPIDRIVRTTTGA